MIELKRGDTLSFVVRRKTETGEPMTGEALKLKSQIRDKFDKLVAVFTITETEIPGDYLLVVPAENTKAFPLGTVYFDVEYRDGNIVTSSDTMEIAVTKDVTRDD